jgi:plasmid stabilization system protein ParE
VPKTLILTEDAQQDLDDAFQWYQEQNHGLGQEFIRCVDAKLSEISRNPLHHQIVFREKVHRALTNRFPFSIYFVNEKDIITVFAILHQRRSPESWKTRTE